MCHQETSPALPRTDLTCIQTVQDVKKYQKAYQVCGTAQLEHWRQSSEQREREGFDVQRLLVLKCDNSSLGLQIPKLRRYFGVLRRLSTFWEGIWSPRALLGFFGFCSCCCSFSRASSLPHSSLHKCFGDKMGQIYKSGKPCGLTCSKQWLGFRNKLIQSVSDLRKQTEPLKNRLEKTKKHPKGPKIQNVENLNHSTTPPEQDAWLMLCTRMCPLLECSGEKNKLSWQLGSGRFWHLSRI